MKKKSKKNQLEILRQLAELYPNPECALDHETPYQLLIATILSAQCTDERVNQVTPHLFKQFSTAEKMSKAPLSKIEELIHSTGFYKNKALSILETSKVITEKYSGQVPETMEELTSLRGVGRKTANVVLGNAFGKNIGVVVDTHVSRLSQRFGFTTSKSAESIEKDLMKLIPQNDWTIISHRLITHGRKYCKSQKPLCEACPVQTICPNFL